MQRVGVTPKKRVVLLAAHNPSARYIRQKGHRGGDGKSKNDLFQTSGNKIILTETVFYLKTVDYKI